MFRSRGHPPEGRSGCVVLMRLVDAHTIHVVETVAQPSLLASSGAQLMRRWRGASTVVKETTCSRVVWRQIVAVHGVSVWIDLTGIRDSEIGVDFFERVYRPRCVRRGDDVDLDTAVSDSLVGYHDAGCTWWRRQRGGREHQRVNPVAVCPARPEACEDGLLEECQRVHPPAVSHAGLHPLETDAPGPGAVGTPTGAELEVGSVLHRVCRVDEIRVFQSSEKCGPRGRWWRRARHACDAADDEEGRDATHVLSWSERRRRHGRKTLISGDANIKKKSGTTPRATRRDLGRPHFFFRSSFVAEGYPSPSAATSVRIGEKRSPNA